ncbi:uncharacterized protein LOC144603179 [Rhinoraja longicauda]
MYTTTSQFDQLAISQRRSLGGFAGRKPTMPQVFTFDPIRENKIPKRRKKRFVKVLYPPRQVRRTLPTQKDMAKRLLLFLLSIVLFQIYTATEDDLSLDVSEHGGGQEALPVPVESPTPSAPVSSALSVVVSPGAGSNCSRRLPAGEVKLIVINALACRM